MPHVKLEDFSVMKLAKHAFPKNHFKFLKLTANTQNLKIEGNDGSMITSLTLEKEIFSEYEISTGYSILLSGKDFHSFINTLTPPHTLNIPEEDISTRLSLEPSFIDILIETENNKIDKKIFDNPEDSIHIPPVHDFEDAAKINVNHNVLRWVSTSVGDADVITMTISEGKIIFKGSSDENVTEFSRRGKNFGEATTRIDNMYLNIISKLHDIRTVNNSDIDLQISLRDMEPARFLFSFAGGQLFFVVGFRPRPR